ncbi:MAG TPA: hypothetical protein VHW24_23480 [Bryobacteraceae bacterium]|jgi:hypothetical protein|nr:hypothetical protein [Bryobacteraceae bacterium]
MASEIGLDDFRNIVEMLQKTIAGMSDLAERVKALEDANQESYTAAVALKENQQQLFEMQKSQQEVLGLMKNSLDQLLRAISGNMPAVN